MSRGALAFVAVPLALAACGATGDLAPGGPESSQAATAPTTPSFGTGGPNESALPPVACEPCDANAACGGPQAACVASQGAPFCAPGCSKDGFCTPDRTCTWVTDPAGLRWRACLPQRDPCGESIETPRPVRPRTP
jgi:hypothetical protein